MKDLIDRIKAKKWSMSLTYSPCLNIYICILTTDEKLVSHMADTPESAIIDAIREMDRHE
jgi:hypothetical protein